MISYWQKSKMEWARTASGGRHSVRMDNGHRLRSTNYQPFVPTRHSGPDLAWNIYKIQLKLYLWKLSDSLKKHSYFWNEQNPYWRRIPSQNGVTGRDIVIKAREIGAKVKISKKKFEFFRNCLIFFREKVKFSTIIQN